EGSQDLQRGPPRLRSEERRLTTLPSVTDMRILIVHPRLSVKGGGERVAIHSIKEALREGHEVYLACEEFDGHEFEDFFGVHGLWETYYLPARVFYRSRVSRIEQLLAVSNFTRSFVRKRWNCESTTLYPPCPIDLYQDLKGPKEDLVITIGRIAPEKRMEVF